MEFLGSKRCILLNQHENASAEEDGKAPHPRRRRQQSAKQLAGAQGAGDLFFRIEGVRRDVAWGSKRREHPKAPPRTL